MPGFVDWLVLSLGLSSEVRWYLSTSAQKVELSEFAGGKTDGLSRHGCAIQQMFRADAFKATRDSNMALGGKDRKMKPYRIVEERHQHDRGQDGAEARVRERRPVSEDGGPLDGRQRQGGG